MKLRSIALATLLCFAPTAAFADGAYRWRDASGRDHFGSNPPKDAIDLQSLNGHRFSRYSTSKLLKGYNRSALSPSPSLEDVAEFNESSLPKTKHGKVTETPIATRSGKVTSSDIDIEPQQSAQLEQGQIMVKRGSKGEITACSLTVKNAGLTPAKNVLVTFEFEDGSLVPAFGAEVIEGYSEEEYAIPHDLLPVSIKGAKAGSEGPLPKVTIQAES